MSGPVRGPLYRETLGPAGATPMVFVHPNPLDGSSWMFQTTHLSTWYRTIAVDLPGYGRSPAADGPLTMPQVAAACWAAVREETSAPAVLVGSSVGSTVVQHMYHLDPDRTLALVVSGAGYNPTKSFAPGRIANYREHGLAYRRQYGFEVLSPEFGATPLGQWLVGLFTERDDHADLDTIVALFEALGVPDPDWLQPKLHAPVLILNGSLDRTHQNAPALAERLPDCEISVIDGAGHACQLEQPWEYDRRLLDFLRRRGIHPPQAPASR